MKAPHTIREHLVTLGFTNRQIETMAHEVIDLDGLDLQVGVIPAVSYALAAETFCDDAYALLRFDFVLAPSRGPVYLAFDNSADELWRHHAARGETGERPLPVLRLVCPA